MNILQLERMKKTEEFTLGNICLTQNLNKKNNVLMNCMIYTLELPFKNNEKDISCIPDGEYIVKKHKSPKFGDCLKVYDIDGISEVKGRSDILIHKGNSVRDFTDKDGFNWKKDSSGCILVGTSYNMDGLVFNSAKAFDILLKYFEEIKESKLIIK